LVKLVAPLVCLLVVLGCDNSPQKSGLITNDAQLMDILKQARAQSQDILVAFEQGQIPTDVESKALLSARDKMMMCRDYQPGEPIHHVTIGKISRAVDEKDTALKSFLQASLLLKNKKALPELDRVLLGETEAEVSQILLQQNKPKDALIHAEFALSLFPESVRYLYYVASAQVQLKQFDDARENLNKAIALDPEFSLASALLKLIPVDAKNSE